MSVLSFVALELQTTHLDPASVSQASYVKLVNGNITLVDSWPVIPPTAGEAVKESTQQTKTWGEALSQLTMMVGALPVVSYYRDADKEVFQAASQHNGDTPPEFRWLDCRELAKKYLPDLPEFQLSTVLQALDLFDEYGDRNSVEQTSQIVIELARRHNIGSVKELWADLYDQPDKLLGLDAGLEGLNFVAVPPPVHEQPTEEAIDERVSDEDTIAGDSASSAEPVAAAQQPAIVESDELHDDPDGSQEESAEEASLDAPLAADDTEPEHESTAATAKAPEPPVEADDSEATEPTNQDHEEAVPDEPDHHIVPAVTPASVPAHSLSETAPTETPETPEDSGTTASQAQDEEPVEDTIPAPSSDENDLHEPVPAVETSDEDFDATAEEVLEPAVPDDEIVPTEPAPSQARTENRTGIPTFEVGEVTEHTQQAATEPERTRKSSVIRTLGFFGVFVFGLLTVVGVVLTVMATMLFFTDTSLMLETKIAGVILTSAITVLSLFMAVFSFKSFRDN